MPKRTLFTNITPLPSQVSREVAIAMLHNHNEMIELNPLVIEHHPIKTPRDAPADEFLDCVWQELTDKIHYLPGGMVKGKVSYRACFHDTPYGLQTHIYAPMGLDIREKWSIGGTLPGEPPEARELGLDVPRQGLYLREDGDMRCNRLLTSFVRKNLDNAHKVLVERILKKAERVEEHHQKLSAYPTSPSSPSFQPGSHMAKSELLSTPMPPNVLSPQLLSPQQNASWQSMMNHPAYRPDDQRYSLPPAYQQQQQQHQQQLQQQPHSQKPQQRGSYYAPVKQPEPAKQFMAELPGSTYHTGHLGPSPQHTPPLEHRVSMTTDSSRSPQPYTQSERSSLLSEIPGQNKYAQHEYGGDGGRSMVSGHSDRASMGSELPSSRQNGYAPHAEQ